MPSGALAMKGFFMDKKRISVSKKRQITIPIEFFNEVGVENEVECFVQNNSIIIRPVKDSGGEFDELILADLISQGLSGDELLISFKKARKQIRPAVKAMLEEAKSAAQNPDNYAAYDDVFAEE